MKKIITPLLFSLFYLFSSNISAQLCNDIPISLVGESFNFEASDFISYGDSMISFELINQHATSFFAYPQAKLIPITALPDGMSLATVNLDWMVFASAWNIDSIALVRIYYDVAMPVPANYTVTFQLWLNNLSPVIDSCYFTDNYVVNLNPTANAVMDIRANNITIFPNPVAQGQSITIQSDEMFDVKTYTIYNLVGATITSGIIQHNQLPLNGIPQGLYVLNITDNSLKNTNFKLIIE